MSLTPAMIDAMVASGCTPEQIAAVVKADMAERELRLTNKRAGDAERQRRHRASRNVTVTECDIEDAPSLSRPPNENNSNPPTHTHPDNNTRARKAHRLPAGWAPKPLPEPLAAAVAVWADGAIARELAKFKDWAASTPGKAGLKSDWDAAWRNWLRRRDEEGTHHNGRQQQNVIGSIRGTRPDPALDMFLQAQRELQAEAERESSGLGFTARPALPPH